MRKDQPNIVLVVMDTARAADVLGESGHSEVMPNLYSIASEGTIFTNASANAPWTLPSHGTLFSGQHPSIHGAHAAQKRFKYGPTLANSLKDEGYHTVAFSNNTWISGEFGFDRGFDEFVTTWQFFQDAVDFGDVAQTRNGLLDQLWGVLGKFRGNPAKNLANLLYGRFLRRRNDDGAKRTNELIADRLPEWLDGNPLFLFVNYLEPHLDYRPPEKFASQWLPDDTTFEEANRVSQDAWGYICGDLTLTDRDFAILRGLYHAELAYLDERISELHNLFMDAGVADETIFVITSDHGENIGDHGLMDHQYSLHETLLKVPLVAFGPGFPGGARVNKSVQLADIMPTLLDIADAPLPEDLPGCSLAAPEDIPADRPLFAEYLAPQPPIETLKQRYECGRDVGRHDRQLRAVYRDGWKYIRGSDGAEWLFDLEDGDHESQDLAEEMPEKRASLWRLLDDWVEELPPIEQEAAEISRSTEERLEDLGYLQ